MTDAIILDQFERLLDRLPPNDPWPEIESSGFLDLMRVDDPDELAGLMPTLLSMIWAQVRRPNAPFVVEAILARMAGRNVHTEETIEQSLADLPNGRNVAIVVGMAQLTGLLRRIESLTLDYASTRSQFGKPIARFQAVQGHLAVLVEETLAAGMACQAAFAVPPHAISDDLANATSIRVQQAARSVTRLAHAAHGAMGISEEYPLGRLVSAVHAARGIGGGAIAAAMALGERVLDSRVTALSAARSI